MLQIDSGTYREIPESLGVLHKDVWHALRRRMEKEARLHKDGDTSLCKWKARLESRGYSVVYQQISAQAAGENGYIFSWVLHWQQKACL